MHVEMFKTTSRLAMVAAAGVFMSLGGVSAVKAADLGGDCCADLEERVATLEATTARKSNKLVSLTVGGQVNRGVLWYNDGSMSGARVADNITSSSRMRLTGDAKIAPGWSAGYYLEIEYLSTGSLGTDQIDSRRASSTIDGTATTQSMGAQPNGHGNSPFSLGIRQSHWYLKNDQLGTLSVGRVNSAAKDIAGIDLGNITVISDGLLRYSGADMFLRRQGTTGREGLCAQGLGCTTTLRWSQLWGGIAEEWRMDGVRYDSATIMGFTWSAAIGDDYRWDTALRYAGSWNGIDVAAGAGYTVNTDELQYAGEPGTVNGTGGTVAGAAGGPFGLKTGRKETHDVKLNASVRHVATGLFITGQWWQKSFHGASGTLTDKLSAVDTKVAALDPDGIRRQRDDITFWRVAAGVRKNVFGIGDTSFYGEYGRADSPLDGTALNTTGATSPGGVNFAAVTSSDMRIWGLGMTQNIDKAAMTMYLGYRNHSAHIEGCEAGKCLGATAVTVEQKFQNLDTVYGGAVIKF
jgi:hypothetical protein